MVRKVCSRATLICVAWALYIALQPHQALAMATGGNGAASWEAVEKCEAGPHPGPWCNIIGFKVDPDSPKVSSIHLELTFDSTLYSFDKAGSGPLCAFAAGRRPCPPPRASLETSVIRVDNTGPGVLPKGARLNTSVDPIKGSQVPSERKLLKLTVDYTLPRAVDVSSTRTSYIYLSNW
jgi:hypothetical protein